MHLALYQPDIPQNTGTILRLCACLGIEAHIIEPAGFPSSDRAFRRAGMYYLAAVALTRHVSWRDFESWRALAGGRLVLFTTKATASYLRFTFAPNDVLLFGRESAGVPEPRRDAFTQCGDGSRSRGRRSAPANRRDARTERKRRDGLVRVLLNLPFPRRLRRGTTLLRL